VPPLLFDPAILSESTTGDRHAGLAVAINRPEALKPVSAAAHAFIHPFAVARAGLQR